MVFHNTSEQCYNWLKNQPSVKEESLTDWLLYDVSANNSLVYYKTFTRNEEATNGTDWEWWILTNEYSTTKAYRFLVQAKKLKSNGADNYPLVTYSNKNGFQIDLLIAEAKERNALPLYAYYSCCSPNFVEQCKNINYISPSTLNWCKQCINGCFFTSAFELYENVFNSSRRKITEQELINFSFGLSLLDIIWHSPNNSMKLLHKLNEHFIEASNLQLCNYPEKQCGFSRDYKDVPLYVKTIIEHKQEDLSWLENEFRYEIGTLAGVLIIDNRLQEKQNRNQLK